MTNEKKQEFTRRISQANKTQLTVIVLQMVETYIEDAMEVWETDQVAYRQAIKRADACLVYLQQTLDFRFPIAGDLFSLYQYAIKQLMYADIKRDMAACKKAKKLMEKMIADFEVISEMDTSEPIMENAQQLYAGFTYGSNGASLDMVSGDASRGFLA